MKIIFTCLLLLCSFTLQAALYKGVDKEGNVTYSDKPFVNSKKITLPPITVVSEPKIPAAAEGSAASEKAENEKNKADKETKYTHLQISSPKNKQTIWNSPKLNVTLASRPALNAKNGDYFQLLIDGKAVVRRSPNTTIQLGYIDRGEHKLQAIIRNRHGQVVKRSKIIIIYIQRTSIVPRHTKAPSASHPHV